MVRVYECQWTGGVVIAKSTTQKITLNLDTFYKLKNSVEQVDKMDRENRTPLSSDGTVQAGWTMFEGKPYLNIRRWVSDDKPSIYGVNLREDEWQTLKLYLVESREMTLIKNAYASLLANKAWSAIKATCNGCRIDHPSQHQHDCLTINAEESVERYLMTHSWKVDRAEVVARAANEALKTGYCLTRPRDILVVVETTMRDEIVKLSQAN